MQHELKSSVPDMLKFSVTYLASPPIEGISSMAKFCWKIVSSCCSIILIRGDTLSWIDEYKQSINILCSSHLATQQPSEDSKLYCEWLSKLREVLSTWNKRLIIGDCNYDELLQYESYQGILPSYFFSVDENATSQVREFEDLFLKMNLALILSSHGNKLFITLHNLLHQYGINVPAYITEHLILPQASDDNGLRNADKLEQIIMLRTKHKACVHVKQGTTLHMLNTLVNDHLVSFMQPLQHYITVLAFFHFNQSKIFNEYMCMQCKVLLEPSLEKRPQSFILGMDEDNGDETAPKRLTTLVLAEATDGAVKQLVNLIEGKSTYSEVVAYGQVNLEQLDIDAEFGVFSQFSQLKLVPINNECGLDALKHLLKLFQIPDHIDCIHDVCEQYNLEGCLNDPIVAWLCEKALYLKSEKSKQEISLSQAMELLKSLKESLCYNTPQADQCIELFKSVRNCIPFRNFILEMKFDREGGQMLFQQQYQLVTAQLQHEEYNENVLNHLTAAMKLISPFLNTKHCFKCLMTNVTQLDWTKGLYTLTTVSENITTIQLWFSRVEVSQLLLETCLYFYLYFRVIHFKIFQMNCNALHHLEFTSIVFSSRRILPWR